MFENNSLKDNHGTSSSEDYPNKRRNRNYDYQQMNRYNNQQDQRYDNHHHQDGSNSGKRSNGRGGSRKPFNPWRLPDRWSEYTSVGQVIPEARVISFKTPLKAQYFGEESIPFGVEELLAQIKELGGELGLVVDLTYTTKYYDPVSFTDKGIEYKKIFCPGRDFEELQKLGTDFVETLKEFFKNNNHNGKWVGVHCTHGLNRTGYLVCRYLHEALGWPIEEAIQKFETARGHPIDREEYVNELKKLNIVDSD